MKESIWTGVKNFIDYANPKKRREAEDEIQRRVNKISDWNDFQNFWKGSLRKGNSDSIDSIKNKFKDLDINSKLKVLDKWDKWVSKKIEEEIISIIADMTSDFHKNPYSDKYETPEREGKVCFVYRFESGRTLDLQEYKLKYTTEGQIVTYSIGIILRNLLVNQINNIINTKSKTRSTSKPNFVTTGDPVKDRYNKLIEKIAMRKSQLEKMKKDDPERELLKNELDNYERAAERMKSRMKS